MVKNYIWILAQNEMADKVKKTKVSASTVKSPQAGSIIITTPTVPVVAAQSLVSPTTQVPTVKVKKDLKTLIPVTDAKSAQKRKHKLISTGNKGLNPKEKLYCVCKTPYDESK